MSALPDQSYLLYRHRRPAKVCLCASLPSEKLVTSGRILVLQHPYEAK